MITRVGLNICPHCGKKLDSVSDIEDEESVTPMPGDVSLCFGCTGILVFDQLLRPRKPTKAELKEIRQDRRYWKELKSLQHQINRLHNH